MRFIVMHYNPLTNRGRKLGTVNAGNGKGAVSAACEKYGTNRRYTFCVTVARKQIWKRHKQSCRLTQHQNTPQMRTYTISPKKARALVPVTKEFRQFAKF